MLSDIECSISRLPAFLFGAHLKGMAAGFLAATSQTISHIRSRASSIVSAAERSRLQSREAILEVDDVYCYEEHVRGARTATSDEMSGPSESSTLMAAIGQDMREGLVAKFLPGLLVLLMYLVLFRTLAKRRGDRRRVLRGRDARRTRVDPSRCITSRRRAWRTPATGPVPACESDAQRRLLSRGKAHRGVDRVPP